MNNYVLVTDSACDICAELLKEWNVEFINQTFRFEGEEKEYFNDEMDINEFYGRMRKGDTAKTAAINPDTFIERFEKILSQGKDVLYLGFSSGLSTTFNSSKIAAEELKERYPERQIICLDTLCASAGQGLLVYLAAEKMRDCANMEELAAYVENLIPNLCHWFTVDDLVYLKRGGRVSPTLAFVGAVLGIKPVLHVDDEGKLISVTKARGRKAAFSTIADKYAEFAEEKSGTVFISHADCLDEAQAVKTELQEKFGADVKIITDIGPVIGAHSGPGTIAVFFIGKKR